MEAENYLFVEGHMLKASKECHPLEVMIPEQERV